MSIHRLDVEPDRFQFRAGDLGPLEIRDLVRLPVSVAVEDRHDRRQSMVDDEFDRLPDLPFAAFSVSDDAEDPLVDLIEASGDRESRGDRESLTQRTGGGVEEGKALDRIGMTVDHRRVVAQCETVLPGHRTELIAIAPDAHAQISTSRVDHRHRVPLAQHESIRSGIPWIRGRPAHVVVHQDGHQMPDAHGTGRMAASRGGGHVECEEIEINGLGVNCGFEGHLAPFRGDRLSWRGRIRPEPRSIASPVVGGNRSPCIVRFTVADAPSASRSGTSLLPPDNPELDPSTMGNSRLLFTCLAFLLIAPATSPAAHAQGARGLPDPVSSAALERLLEGAGITDPPATLIDEPMARYLAAMETLRNGRIEAWLERRREGSGMFESPDPDLIRAEIEDRRRLLSAIAALDRTLFSELTLAGLDPDAIERAAARRTRDRAHAVIGRRFSRGIRIEPTQVLEAVVADGDGDPAWVIDDAMRNRALDHDRSRTERLERLADLVIERPLRAAEAMRDVEPPDLQILAVAR